MPAAGQVFIAAILLRLHCTVDITSHSTAPLFYLPGLWLLPFSATRQLTTA